MLELCPILTSQDLGPANSRDVFGETSPELLTCRREQSWGQGNVSAAATSLGSPALSCQRGQGRDTKDNLGSTLRSHLAHAPAQPEPLQVLLPRTSPGLWGLSEKSLLSLNSYFLANPVARAQPWCNRHLLVVISAPLPKPTYKILYLAPILSVTSHKKKKNPLKEIKAGAAWCCKHSFTLILSPSFSLSFTPGVC